MSLIDINAVGMPGAYVFENTFGSIPQGIAQHNNCYMIGYSTKAGAPREAFYIQSLADFANVYGASASQSSVALYFNQRPGKGLWFINVEPRGSYTLTLASVTSGNTYGLTFDGFAVNVTATATDTPTTVLAKLAQKVNTTVPHAANIRNNVLKVETGTVVTATGVTLGTLVPAPASPDLNDVLDSMNRELKPHMEPGFIIAPEFWLTWTDADDLQALAQGMEALAQDTRYYWATVVDVHEDTATSTTGGGAVNRVLAEKNLLTSPRGHASIAFPWLVDNNDTLVPGSAAVVGLACRRYRQEGFRQPPAGVQYPIYGVKKLSIEVTDLMQEVLNPAGINCFRVFPGDGVVMYGARTISTDPYYTFITTRIIFNVLNRTLRDALKRLVFTSVDGQGIVFGRIKTTAVTICERLRLAGALFGATPNDAYLVVCDLSNNPGIDLDNGIVHVDVYAKPSPTLERLFIGTFRTSLATDLNTEVVYDAATRST